LLVTRNLTMNNTSAVSLTDFDSFPAGLYFIRVTGNSGQQVLRAVKL
jgi:hypothetical protein